MKLIELFDDATIGWPADEIEILRADIKAQKELRAAWITTLQGLVDFEINCQYLKDFKK